MCTKQLHQIQSLLTDQNQIHVLQRERGKLEARMHDFASAHEVLYDTFETEERIKHNARYDDLNARNRETLLLIKESIYGLQSQMEDRQSPYSAGKQSCSSGCSKTAISIEFLSPQKGQDGSQGR